MTSKILRNAIVTAGAAATILMSTTPASAQTAVGFPGTASIGCFGCGEYGPVGNYACLPAYGEIWGHPVFGLEICAEFTVTEPVGNPCGGAVEAQLAGTLAGA